ncbi:MAG: citramalate synthase [Thermoguttaceae bacterium]
MRHIEIYDTTLRDGSQAEGVSFSLHDKLRLAERLDALGFDFIEGGFPGSNEKDAEFFVEAVRTHWTTARIAAFGMTRRKGMTPRDDAGIASLLAAETPVVTLVGKASAFQVTDVIRATLDENLAMIAETVAYIREQNRDVFFDAEHFFDGFAFDAVYALEALDAAARAGATRLILCDTNGGTMPQKIAAAVETVVKKFPHQIVGIHTHNDCGLAVAGSLAAVEAGASHVQGTIGGIGERCGNANLIEVIANLALKSGGKYKLLRDDSIRSLTDLARFLYETLNVTAPMHSPFVGRSAFAHKGGMHGSGVSRTTSSYEHIAPETVGNERRVLVSELSGVANIQSRLESFVFPRVDGTLPRRVLEEVVRLENDGFQFEAADGSFEILVRKCAGLYKPHFERLKFHVNVEADERGIKETEATVKLIVGESLRHEVATGDGPVHALEAALRKALVPYFPRLAEIKLIDFKVRIVNSEAATAAKIRVFIETRDGSETWGTVGVSENIVEASWSALVDAIEYKLNKDETNIKRSV